MRRASIGALVAGCLAAGAAGAAKAPTPPRLGAAVNGKVPTTGLTLNFSSPDPGRPLTRLDLYLSRRVALAGGGAACSSAALNRRGPRACPRSALRAEGAAQFDMAGRHTTVGAVVERTGRGRLALYLQRTAAYRQVGALGVALPLAGAHAGGLYAARLRLTFSLDQIHPDTGLYAALTSLRLHFPSGALAARGCPGGPLAFAADATQYVIRTGDTVAARRATASARCPRRH